MKTHIKICGITTLEQGLAAAGYGAHGLGFVFYQKSSRVISPDVASAIIKELPPFISSVGLFVNPDADYVREIISQVPLNLLQFSGAESPAFCDQFNFPYYKAFHMKPGIQLIEEVNKYPNSRAVLLDTFKTGEWGGTGESFDWSLVPGKLQKPVMISGGLTPNNVGQVIQQCQPYGVDVSSGVESQPGVKDIHLIKSFIEEVNRG